MKPRSSRTNLLPHQTAIIAAILVSCVAYLVPPLHLAFLPIQYLDTHLHEMCHALMAVGTGGQPEDIIVRSNGSGETPVMGGNMFLVASAGYLGATLLGAAMIFFGSTPGRARGALLAIAACLGISMLLWVRGDAVGVAMGLFWMAALFCGGWFLHGMPALFVCQLIGFEQCLNAVGSVYELLKISVYTEVHSDATILANLTMIPAAVWATLWCLFSVVMVGFTVRKAWALKEPQASPQADPR
jgi:hypothetical protein